MAGISVNIVVLGGHLSRDPELRFTPKGTAVCAFSVAVNRSWKTESGEKRDEVSFLDCVAWGRTGETIAQYLKKGSPILVQGHLKQESWEDRQTGARRYAVKVMVDSFNFVGAKADGAKPEAGRPAAAPPASTAPQEDTGAPPSENDDDIPF